MKQDIEDDWAIITEKQIKETEFPSYISKNILQAVRYAWGTPHNVKME